MKTYLVHWVCVLCYPYTLNCFTCNCVILFPTLSWQVLFDKNICMFCCFKIANSGKHEMYTVCDCSAGLFWITLIPSQPAAPIFKYDNLDYGCWFSSRCNFCLVGQALSLLFITLCPSACANEKKAEGYKFLWCAVVIGT